MEDQEPKHLVYAFPRAKGEEVQICLRKYKGKSYVDVRIWFQGKNETDFYPTKKGISFSPELVPELRKGVERLAKAMERSRFSKEEVEI